MKLRNKFTTFIVQNPKVPEFNYWSVYIPGDVVWFGELQYIAKDFVTGEQPDESPNWEIYVKVRP